MQGAHARSACYARSSFEAERFTVVVQNPQSPSCDSSGNGSVRVGVGLYGADSSGPPHPADGHGRDGAHLLFWFFWVF